MNRPTLRVVSPTCIPVSRSNEEAPNRVEIRQKPETRRIGQSCFHSPFHVISITPLPVFVITSCHCPVWTYCWLYAHVCAPVTPIQKDRAPGEEVMSCLLRFWKGSVVLMISKAEEVNGADEDIWVRRMEWLQELVPLLWGRRRGGRKQRVKFVMDKCGECTESEFNFRGKLKLPVTVLSLLNSGPSFCTHWCSLSALIESSNMATTALCLIQVTRGQRLFWVSCSTNWQISRPHPKLCKNMGVHMNSLFSYSCIETRVGHFLACGGKG